MSSTPHTFIFAGGGSGGHLYPGLAVAERIREQLPDARIFFLCSDRAIDAKILGDAGEEFFVCKAAPAGRRPKQLVRLLTGTLATIKLTRGLIRAYDGGAHVTMIAMGGFVAAPAAFGAKREGAHVVMVNLDAVPGKANRLLVRWADDVLSATEQSAFDAELVGPVVRRGALPPADKDAAACRGSFGLDPKLRTVLVTGGSQGARSINDTLAAIVSHDGAIFDGWQILHQCGDEASIHGLVGAYRDAGVRAEVRAYLDEMGAAWGAADLTVCRAGAGTVGEAWGSGTPAVFMPYPFHRDDHQRANAQALVGCGAARIVRDELDAEKNRVGLLDVLDEVIGEPDRLARMREGYKTLGGVDGAGQVARCAISAF